MKKQEGKTKERERDKDKDKDKALSGSRDKEESSSSAASTIANNNVGLAEGEDLSSSTSSSKSSLKKSKSFQRTDSSSKFNLATSDGAVPMHLYRDLMKSKKNKEKEKEKPPKGKDRKRSESWMSMLVHGKGGEQIDDKFDKKKSKTTGSQEDKMLRIVRITEFLLEFLPPPKRSQLWINCEHHSLLPHQVVMGLTCGKTSMLTRFTSDQFNDSYSPTASTRFFLPLSFLLDNLLFFYRATAL